MSADARATSPASPLIDVAILARQWASGPLVYSRWLIALLDAQTTLWKEAERCTAALMQPWLGPSLPPPSLQPLMDVVQGLTPLGPAAMRRACAAWTQVCVEALRHDAGEG